MYDAPEMIAAILALAWAAVPVLSPQDKAPSRPTIVATPNPVPAGTGGGRTTITWTTGADADGEVRVSIAGAPDRVFARGKSGSSVADWIQAGTTYEFTLYAPTGAVAIASVRVTRAAPPPGAAWISAAPNPIPAGAAPGETTVTWTTGNGTEGRVKVSTDGGLERTVAAGPKGTLPVNWISGSSMYEFRLYTATVPSTLLARVSVSRAPADSIPHTPPDVDISRLGGSDPEVDPRVRVNWTTGDRSDGVVYVSTDGGPGEVFGQGPTGSVIADWIRPTSSYEFKLYSVSSRALLASASLIATAVRALESQSDEPLSAERIATIRSRSFLTATPNPVPPGLGGGTSEVAWNLDALGHGQVAVAVDGGAETTLASGSGGTTSLTVRAGMTYELRLYGGQPRALILSTTVTRQSARPWALSGSGVALVLILAATARRLRARRSAAAGS